MGKHTGKGKKIGNGMEKSVPHSVRALMGGNGSDGGGRKEGRKGEGLPNNKLESPLALHNCICISQVKTLPKFSGEKFLSAWSWLEIFNFRL